MPLRDTPVNALGLARPGPSQTGPLSDRGVGLKHCSDAVSMLPLRAPQRALDELTPANGHTSTKQRGSFFA